uniref:Uncharacterized protein n=1 Tax=Molossus molossus TaxID=27622 RepID=A0A7J8FYR8_MOLMO|nr:hypothetical protein HJG59_008149 [Molossus molossus]
MPHFLDWFVPVYLVISVLILVGFGACIYYFEPGLQEAHKWRVQRPTVDRDLRKTLMVRDNLAFGGPEGRAQPPQSQAPSPPIPGALLPHCGQNDNLPHSPLWASILICCNKKTSRLSLRDCLLPKGSFPSPPRRLQAQEAKQRTAEIKGSVLDSSWTLGLQDVTGTWTVCTQRWRNWSSERFVTCSKLHSCNKPRFETPDPVPLVWEATTMIFFLLRWSVLQGHFQAYPSFLWWERLCM